MPGKKKGKGKKAKKQENRTDVLTEVDKTFYELQITDLNRKLARLKQTSQELEDKNQQLEKKLDNLDEDRADVISYLKRTVLTKQSESLELQERVTALQETKDSEGKEYEDKIEDLQLENKAMRDQLTSEIKLLTGKLNALEEFRMQRDELMERFEQQEKTIQEQEKKEKKTMYEIEKKFIMSKKNIASEMEKQLFNLANDFEKANEVRIAATTHRCIRENIILNNELNKMATTLGNLNEQVEEYKAKNIELRLNCELYQAERNKTINELHVVRSHLDQMTRDLNARVKILRAYENEMKKSQKTYEDMKHAQARETALAAKVRVLEQNLHASRCKGTDLKQLVSKQNKLVKHFQDVNREAVIAIEDCLKISLHPRLDEAGKQYRRDLLLQNLLTILTQPKIDTHTVLSMETIESIDAKYKRGDLGFLPKEVHYAKPKDFQMLNAAVQVTPRYDEMPISPNQSHKTNGSFDSQSLKTISTEDSFHFQACSMLDIQERSHTVFSSIIFPERFISESQIDQLLSSTSQQFNLESLSTLITTDMSKDFSRRDTNPLDGEEKEIAVTDDENEVAKIEEITEEEANIEDKSVPEDMENTVFGNDDDDADDVDTSPDDGAAVETEKCGGNDASDTNWECIYGSSDASIGGNEDVSPADRPEILAEVGPGCRCGCVIHLGQAKPRRLLATSSHSCPGRTFWLIQADENHVVRFKVDHYRLPCSAQWLKVRDGNSLSATLLAQLSGGDERRSIAAPTAVQSTGQHLLLEFFSDELELAGGEMCGGGFLAHAQQLRTSSSNGTVVHSQVSVSAAAAAAAAAPVGVAAGARLTAVHIAALLLASVVLVATALLAAQYVLRYRKYHIAEDMDSLADSNASLAIRARASSSATLLSEVISLTRLRPPGTARNRHTRLRESMDMDCGDVEREACVDDDDMDIINEERVGSGKSGNLDEGSYSSTMTLTPPEHPNTPKIPLAVAEKDSSSSPGSGSASVSISPAPSLHSEASIHLPPGSLESGSRLQQYVSGDRTVTIISPGSTSSSGISESLSVTPNPGGRRHHHHRGHQRKLSATFVAAAALTNGCYSPAASIISTATIRSTNPKESKEKRNRERLLAGPGGSEFSIAGPDTDLELDYYDYNVVNAGAVPGSYLGMDPQYLVWIPPLDETGEILQTLEKEDKYPFEYEDIRPKQFIDPGSNQESPEEEMLLPKRRKSLSEAAAKLSPSMLKKKIASSPDDKISPLMKRVDLKCTVESDLNTCKELSPLLKRVDSSKCAIPLHEFPKRLGLNSPAKVHRPSEKETRVEKSPSSAKSYDLDEIKFADDECEDLDAGESDIVCNKQPYQDSNIITSNNS